MSERVQHVILFNFPAPLSEEEEKEMFERVRSWPSDIPGFTGLRFGKDVGGRSEGYEYLLWTEFENEEAHQAYYSHPVHVAFRNWIAERNPEAIRNDYALTPDNLIL